LFGIGVALPLPEGRTIVPIKQSLWLLALGLFAISLPLRAQTPSRRAEIGVHYSSINLNVFDSTEGGGGIRFSYYLTNYLAVDAEGNIFDPRIGDYPTDDFLAAQGFVGVKAGIRRKRFGTFAKVRPGVANFPVLRVNRRFCSSLLPCETAGGSGNRFALDTGAIFEAYPTSRVVVRFDVGDTMIRYDGDSFFRSPGIVRISDGMSHNLQWGIGVGFRF